MIDWPSSPFDGDEDEADVDASVDGTKLLIKLSRSAASLPWFARLGEPLRMQERRLGEAYCDALGFPGTDIIRLTGWSDAGIAAENRNWDSDAWSAAEQLRSALAMDACAIFGEEFVSESLQGVVAYVSQILRERVLEVAALWEVTDEALINAASGAALRAIYNAALVLLAGSDDDHALALEYRLFECGRWPVVLAGRTLHLF